MNVVVDGIVYGFQRHGGINTYFNQILPRIAARPDTRVSVLLPRVVEGAPPGPPVRHVPRELIPYRTGLSWRLDQAVEAAVRSLSWRWHGLVSAAKRQTIFHSSYFTILPSVVPQIGIAHDMNHEVFADKYDAIELGRWLRQQYPRYLRAAARIIAVSHVTKADVVRFYGIDEALIDVVYLATDVRDFFVERDEKSLGRVRAALRGDVPYLLYVGGRSPLFKNFETLLGAISQCAQATGLTLVVAGPSWNREEESILAGRGLNAYVRLVEHPNIDLLRSLYNFATAFVFPSHREGFGLPLLEAMACGTPVIAADTSVFREVGGDAAVYFAPSDVADLVRAIEELSDKTIRETHVQRGFAQVAKYSWDRCAAETYAVYERVLGDSTPARRTLRGRD